MLFFRKCQQFAERVGDGMSNLFEMALRDQGKNITDIACDLFAPVLAMFSMEAPADGATPSTTALSSVMAVEDLDKFLAEHHRSLVAAFTELGGKLPGAELGDIVNAQVNNKIDID